VSNAAGFAIDPAAGQMGRIYWTNKTTIDSVPSTISFADLDGSGGADLPATGARGHQAGFAILDGKGYWAGALSTTPFGIAFAALNGAGGGMLTITPPSDAIAPRGGVAIDPVEKRIYWVTVSSAIASANLDGSDTRLLATPGATVELPTDLHVDLVNRRIYWSNIFVGNDQRFGYANLDGTGGGEIMLPNDGRSDTFAVDSVGGQIYWPGPGAELWSVNVDGSDAGEVKPKPPPPPPPVDTTLHAPPEARTHGDRADRLPHAQHLSRQSTPAASGARSTASASTVPSPGSSSNRLGSRSEPAIRSSGALSLGRKPDFIPK
jgi:hypothetical protein